MSTLAIERSSRRHLASVRVKRDIEELSKDRMTSADASTAIEFPEGESNVLGLRLTVTMLGGMYAGGRFTFQVAIPPQYPFRAPVVTAEAPLWHPNVELAQAGGRVALPLLTRDWRPVLSLNTVVFALQLLFLEPNGAPEFAANAAASDAFNRAPQTVFVQQVRHTLAGLPLPAAAVTFAPHPGCGAPGSPAAPAARGSRLDLKRGRRDDGDDSDDGGASGHDSDGEDVYGGGGDDCSDDGAGGGASASCPLDMSAMCLDDDAHDGGGGGAAAQKSPKKKRRALPPEGWSVGG